MKLTIITINFNNLEGLKRTLPSVIGQTYKGFQYIVIDGGSTDGSKEYIEQYPRIDFFVSEPDEGIYNAMNKGIKYAEGEYCLFMNSGDMFFSSTVLESAVPLLDGEDFYAGGAVFIKQDQKAETWLPPKKMTISYILNNSLCHQSLFNKTRIMKERPFNEELKIAADWEHFILSWKEYHNTYKCIPNIISIYFMDGISFVNQELCNQERALTIQNILSKEFAKTNYSKAMIAINRKNKAKWREGQLQKKLTHAMLLKPLSRDWKIIRNGIKFFFRDLFDL